MAKVPFDNATFDKWLENQPQRIKDLAAKYPPDRLYLFKHSGKRGVITGLSEDEFCVMEFDGTYDFVQFAHVVRGIPLSEVEECDFLPDDAPKGCRLNTNEEIAAYVHKNMHEGQELNRDEFVNQVNGVNSEPEHPKYLQ